MIRFNLMILVFQSFKHLFDCIFVVSKLFIQGLDVFRRASERCIKLVTFHLSQKKNSHLYVEDNMYWANPATIFFMEENYS